MLLALTRSVSPAISECELTHLARSPIDYARAVAQHGAYEDALRRAGCEVRRLPDALQFPDSVFVEDTAVVFDEIAVIARPGAESRRREVDGIAGALAPYRPLKYIAAPGTLDGGDVLVTPGRIFVGISGRTNAEGARQFASHVAPFGFDVIPVPVQGCLHLKSAVTVVDVPADRNRPADAGSLVTLVINPGWIDRTVFGAFDLIEVADEPAAANVLAVNGYVICAEEHPRTRARLEARGYPILAVPAGELAKAEGGVTCCSIVVGHSSLKN